MNTEKITSSITHALLVIVFFTVVGFSLFLAEELSWTHLAVAFIKGCIAVGLAWIFFYILLDALVKSVITSALASQAKRFNGGLLFHFIKPEAQEIFLDEKVQSEKKQPALQVKTQELKKVLASKQNKKSSAPP